MFHVNKSNKFVFQNNFPFPFPLEISETRAFLVFSGVIERENRSEVG